MFGEGARLFSAPVHQSPPPPQPPQPPPPLSPLLLSELELLPESEDDGGVRTEWYAA